MSEVSGKSADGPESLPALPDMRLEQFFLATLRGHIFLDDRVAADQHGTPNTAWERVAHIAWCVLVTDAGGHCCINSSGSRSSLRFGRACCGGWAVWRCTMRDLYLPRCMPSVRPLLYRVALPSHSFLSYSRG